MAAPKVELRSVGSDDRDRLLRWRNSPEVAAYMFTDHPISPQEHDLWLSRVQGDATRAHWVIELDGEPVGLANIYDLDRDGGSCGWGLYLAEPSVRGKGVGSMVTYLVIEKVFSDLGLGMLWCEVLASNQRGRRLYQKFGFREESGMRHDVLKNGVPEAAIKLRLLAEEWAMKKAAMLDAPATDGQVP